MEYDKKIKNITPHRAGQLMELAADLAKRMTISRYGYLEWNEVEVVLDTLRNCFESAHQRGEI